MNLRRAAEHLEITLAVGSFASAAWIAWLAVGVPSIAAMLAAPFALLPVLALAEVRSGRWWLIAWLPLAIVAALGMLIVPLTWPFLIPPVLAALTATVGLGRHFGRTQLRSAPF